MVISSPVKSPVLTTEMPSKASIKLIERSAAPNPNHQPLFYSVACGTSIIEGSILAARKAAHLGSCSQKRRRSPFGEVLHQSATTAGRSEEHTSELQSRQYLVCRL